MIQTRRCSTNISWMKIYVNYSNSYGIMSQDNETYCLHTEVDGSETLHRSHKHALAWVSVSYWCPDNNVFRHRSCDNNQRQEPWISFLWLPACLTQCVVKGSNNYGLPLLSLADLANIWPWSVDCNWLMKPQPPSGRLLAHFAIYNQIPNLVASLIIVHSVNHSILRANT